MCGTLLRKWGVTLSVMPFQSIGAVCQLLAIAHLRGQEAEEQGAAHRFSRSSSPCARLWLGV